MLSNDRHISQKSLQDVGYTWYHCGPSALDSHLSNDCRMIAKSLIQDSHQYWTDYTLLGKKWYT